MAKIIKLKKPDDQVEVIECEQRSDEWFAARLGLITASGMSALMANSEQRKMRQKLLYRLAGELLTGVPIETYTNESMKRGIEMERAALDHYAFVKGVDLTYVGLVKRTIKRAFTTITVAASPDALVGDDGGVEIKTMQPDLLAELIVTKQVPTGHRWQIHANMWVTGRKWWDLKIYYQGFPTSPVFRFERNEGLIAQMTEEAERADYEIREIVRAVRKS